MLGRLDQHHGKRGNQLYMVACYRIERYDRSNGYGNTGSNHYLQCYRNGQRMQQHCKRYDHCSTDTNGYCVSSIVIDLRG